MPRIGWGSTDEIKTLNLCMLYIIAIIVDLFGLYYVQLTRSWYHNQMKRPQSRVKSYGMTTEGPAFMSSIQSSVGKQEKVESVDAQDSNTWPNSLAVRGLSYHVPFKQKSKLTMSSLLRPLLVRLSGNKTKDQISKQKEITLLSNVEARFARGRMCALMGSSGAGKTTLLDVITGYKTGGRITGNVMLAGQPKQAKIWKEISGFAEQLDILNPYLSLLETIRFTATCRFPKDVDREEAICQVVNLMDIKEWHDVVVGREMEGEGLPKHVRKRLTIAIQLVVKPKILFLDEPITGLGTNASALVTASIRRGTDTMGLITLATIHQPSFQIWDNFDDLLLLAKGGRVAYMGEMGAASETVLNHFQKLSNKDSPPSCNPADHVLSLLTSVEPDEAVIAFADSELAKFTQDAIDIDMKQDSAGQPHIDNSNANSAIMEVLLLTKRQIITQWRNPSYSLMRLLSSLLVSLYMGILFFGDKSTINGAVGSIGSIFFLVFVLVIPMAAAVVPLIEDRAVLYRETVSGTYSRLSYGIGSLFADMPFHLLNMLFMFVAFYFLVGFRLEGDIVGYFVLMLFLANWVIMSIGQLYALASPNEESAHGLAGLSVNLSVILMGFLITVSAMPDNWTWAYWANLFHYILQGLVSNELVDKAYHLDLDLSGMLPGNFTDPSNLVIFEPGVDGMEEGSNAVEAASLLGLVTAAGNGTNPFSALENVRNLFSCFATNECMSNVPISVILCISGFQPACKDEFEAAVAALPVGEITQCFIPDFGGNETNSTDPDFGLNSTIPDANSTDPDFGGNATIPDYGGIVTIPEMGERGNETNATYSVFIGSPDTIDGTPRDFSIARYGRLAASSQLELILCLVRAVLTLDVTTIVKNIIEMIRENFDVLLILLSVIRNGIDLPGELILFFFGWVEFKDGSFQAENKWHYCMPVVVVFLAAIELFKLIAVRFIVWISVKGPTLHEVDAASDV